jgi:hypothetical protein
MGDSSSRFTNGQRYNGQIGEEDKTATLTGKDPSRRN